MARSHRQTPLFVSPSVMEAGRGKLPNIYQKTWLLMKLVLDGCELGIR